MTDCRETGENAFSASITFDSGFTGFDGHFEGNPVVPGVCLIELVRIHAETVMGIELESKEISLCRFRRPLLANVTAESRITLIPHDGTWTVQAQLMVGGEAACKLKMEVVKK